MDNCLIKVVDKFGNGVRVKMSFLEKNKLGFMLGKCGQDLHSFNQECFIGKQKSECSKNPFRV